MRRSTPPGTIAPVEGTHLDFCEARRIEESDPERKGIDNNYILRPGRDQSDPAAWASCPRTGLRLRVWTDQPGLQIFNAATMTIGAPGYRAVILSSIAPRPAGSLWRPKRRPGGSGPRGKSWVGASGQPRPIRRSATRFVSASLSAGSRSPARPSTGLAADPLHGLDAPAVLEDLAHRVRARLDPDQERERAIRLEPIGGPQLTLLRVVQLDAAHERAFRVALPLGAGAALAFVAGG